MNDLLLWIGAAIAALFAAYMRGRISGAEKERQRQAQAEAKARDTAAKIDRDVDAMSGGSVKQELRKWAR